MRVRFYIQVLLTILTSTVWQGSFARADVGLVIYDSKGVDTRRTNSGHIALIVTDLCAKGIEQVRACLPDEEPGVVITRYGNLAAGYEKTVFVSPQRDHFAGTYDLQLVPVLSSGATLEAMQIEYWRKHLKSYLPPLSQERYEVLHEELTRFNAAREIRKTLTLEFIGTALSAHKKHYPTEPIALIDPTTQELIPNGRWREAIGVQQVRSSIIITTPAPLQAELRLVDYIDKAQLEPFNVLSNNCSDFAKGGLSVVLAESDLHFRPRSLDLADAWITSPLWVASDFLKYARKGKHSIKVLSLPMMAGTRVPTSQVRSLSRGSLVPDPNQGKLALGLKTYINTLNPLLGITALSVDRLSRLADLPQLVHERSGGSLSDIANQLSVALPDEQRDLRDRQRREQVRVIGTRSCWKGKEQDFATVVSQAVELGLLTKAEKSLTLLRDRPFLLPRLYERLAARNGSGSLVEGMKLSLAPGFMRGMALGFRAEASNDTPGVHVPSRKEIREMAASSDRTSELTAFKIMTSVINFDLSSEPGNRRAAQAFDPDWILFESVAEATGLRVPTRGSQAETLESCSCREYDQGLSQIDAVQQERAILSVMAREGRAFLFSPLR
jgi:hypothetical protein